MAEIDCIDCLLKIVPNTSIHTEVTTLGNIIFAEHLGILLMLSYSLCFDCLFHYYPEYWTSITLLYSLINRTICCDTVLLTVQTAVIHYSNINWPLLYICYPEFHTVQFIVIKIHYTFVIHTWSYVTIRPINTYKGAMWLSWLLLLTWSWHAWLVYTFVLYW